MENSSEFSSRRACRSCRARGSQRQSWRKQNNWRSPLSDAIDRWTVGDVTITRVVEFEIGGFPPGFMFAGLTEERVKSIDWLHPHYADPDGTIRYAVQAFVVESQGRRIIVDTCVGNDKERGNDSLEPSQASLPGAADRGGLPTGVDRHRPLHAPALGSCRLEHTVGWQQMGPDVPKRPLSIWTDGIRALDLGKSHQRRHAGPGHRAGRARCSHGRFRASRS